MEKPCQHLELRALAVRGASSSTGSEELPELGATIEVRRVELEELAAGLSPKSPSTKRYNSLPFLPQIQSPKSGDVDRSVPEADSLTVRSLTSAASVVGDGTDDALIALSRGQSDTDIASPLVSPAVRQTRKQKLLAAMEKRDYWKLKAAIAAMRARHTGSAEIYEAERLLRSLQVPKLPKSLGLSHVRVQKVMRWKAVTTFDAGPEALEQRRAQARRACSPGHGEQFALDRHVVQSALAGIAPRGVPADMWLFKGLVKLAAATQEQCVVNNAGNFLLTRDASISAFASLLERAEATSTPLGKAIWTLKAHAENYYCLRVVAAQVNFHPDGTTFHKQHQDKYRGGTVAYSLGSSRKACAKPSGPGEWGTGRPLTGDEETFMFDMTSGDAMYFNQAWNESNSHGIPRLDEPCGPRLSLVFFGH